MALRKKIYRYEVVYNDCDIDMDMDDISLEDLHYEITEGHCSGQWLKPEEDRELTHEEAYEALQMQGVDPMFLCLSKCVKCGRTFDVIHAEDEEVCAGCQDEAEAVGTKIGDRLFSCPNCGCHRIKEDFREATVSRRIERIEEGGTHFSSQEVDFGSGKLVKFKCASCYFEIRKRNSYLVKNYEELVEWARENCPQKDETKE